VVVYVPLPINFNWVKILENHLSAHKIVYTNYVFMLSLLILFISPTVVLMLCLMCLMLGLLFSFANCPLCSWVKFDSCYAAGYHSINCLFLKKKLYYTHKSCSFFSYGVMEFLSSCVMALTIWVHIILRESVFASGCLFYSVL